MFVVGEVLAGDEFLHRFSAVIATHGSFVNSAQQGCQPLDPWDGVVAHQPGDTEDAIGSQDAGDLGQHESGSELVESLMY